MTCQECELALASEIPTGVEDHLAVCVACREFALDLRENSELMLAFAADPMPSVRPIRQSRPWPWVAAAAISAIAAMLLLIFSTPKVRTPLRPRLADGPGIAVNVAPAVPQIEPVKSHIHRRVPKKNVQPQILQVKMLTDDPEVVIYWQVEN